MTVAGVDVATIASQLCRELSFPFKHENRENYVLNYENIRLSATVVFCYIKVFVIFE